jgi:hypothetical protein
MTKTQNTTIDFPTKVMAPGDYEVRFYNGDNSARWFAKADVSRHF